MEANRTSSSSLVGLPIRRGLALLGAQAEMDQQRGVAAVVENHVRGAAVAPLEDAVLVVPVVLERLALDREHRRAAGGDGGGGMVLGRIDVAGGPAHVGAERLERLDQHRGLDGHVQRAADARAAQRLRRAIFLARRHQARHLDLGDGDFLAAPFGESDVLDDVIGGTAAALWAAFDAAVMTVLDGWECRRAGRHAVCRRRYSRVGRRSQ